MRASLSARKLARQPRSSLTCSAHWHARALGRRRPGRAGCAAAAHHQAGAQPPAARRSPPRSPASPACASKPHKQGAQQSTAHSTHRRRARSTRRRARASNTHTRTARARRTPAQRCTQSTLAHSSSSSLPQSNPHTRARTLPTAGARIGRRREEPTGLKLTPQGTNETPEGALGRRSLRHLDSSTS